MASAVGQDAFEALLETVAHDLRSPLLAMALGTQLLQDAGGAEQEQVAYDALREGIRDLERMLDGVATVSRAAKRTLAPRSTLGGVVPSDLLPDDVSIDADARLVAELLDALDLDAAQLELRIDDDAVELNAPLPATFELADGSPLAALLDSLTTHAGSLVEQLAAIELQAARQGGALTVADGRASLRLPRTSSVG